MDIMHLINRKQNGVAITIGPFGSINRELFKIVNEFCIQSNMSRSKSFILCVLDFFPDYKQSVLFCDVFAQLYSIKPKA